MGLGDLEPHGALPLHDLQHDTEQRQGQAAWCRWLITGESKTTPHINAPESKLYNCSAQEGGVWRLLKLLKRME